MLGRMLSSTSCLRRRRRKGGGSAELRDQSSSPLICHRVLLREVEVEPRLERSRSSKIFGSRKLSSDHSSGRLFSGVPVSSSRLHSWRARCDLELGDQPAVHVLEAVASSITTNFQPSFLSSFESRMTISYDVIITGAALLVFMRQLLPSIAVRSAFGPW